MLLLDITNACGSVPHKLVEEVLNMHLVLDRVNVLILDYYNSFNLTAITTSTTSE